LKSSPILLHETLTATTRVHMHDIWSRNYLHRSYVILTPAHLTQYTLLVILASFFMNILLF